jgi:hypothetical protein
MSYSARVDEVAQGEKADRLGRKVAGSTLAGSDNLKSGEIIAAPGRYIRRGLQGISQGGSPVSRPELHRFCLRRRGLLRRACQPSNGSSIDEPRAVRDRKSVSATPSNPWSRCANGMRQKALQAERVVAILRACLRQSHRQYRWRGRSRERGIERVEDSTADSGPTVFCKV